MMNKNNEKRNLNQEEKDRISSLAKEYEFKESSIVGYYETLMLYPFIVNGEEERKWECLQMIVEDRNTQEEFGNDSDIRRKLSDTISDSIYRVYGDEALNFLNKEFLESHSLIDDGVDFNILVLGKGLNYDEMKYHGYR